MPAWTRALAAALTGAAGALAARSTFNLNPNWRFQLQGNGPPPKCADPNATFPIVEDGQQCTGLTQVLYAQDLEACIDACCGDSSCGVYQFCPDANGCSGGGAALSCWTGPLTTCQKGSGWVSRARHVTPTPTPAPGALCTDPRCQTSTDDSSWRLLDLPHDFVVEGNYSKSADMSHGYLPYGVGWYRKHFTLDTTPRPPPSTHALWLDLDGVQTASTVWLNNVTLGMHASGYTGQRYWVPVDALNWGGDNLLAVEADATNPDGWWYDGG